MNGADFSCCAVALKEWSATIGALEAGRQILILRKGGLLDPDGVFELEYSRFWLAPTRFHQDENLVKPHHRDLLAASASRGVLALKSWAQVERTWTVDFGNREKLARLEYIWSTRYLETRFDYQKENPLLVIGLRIHVLETPHVTAMKAEHSGCKSWIEMGNALPLQPSRPALDDENFARQIQTVRRVLEC